MDLRLWATAIASGIPNELYWSCTPQEIGALLDAVRDRERHATLRAALVAATIVNVNRKMGARLVQPQDFLLEIPKPEDYMSIEEAQGSMDSWAKSANTRFDDVPPEASAYYTAE